MQKNIILALITLLSTIYTRAGEIAFIDLGPNRTLCSGGELEYDITKFEEDDQTVLWYINSQESRENENTYTGTISLEGPVDTVRVFIYKKGVDPKKGDPLAQGQVILTTIAPLGKPNVDSITMCNDTCMTISGPIGGNSYQWANHTTLNDLQVQSPMVCNPDIDHVYSVTTFYGPINDQCIQVDEINVFVAICDTSNDSTSNQDNNTHKQCYKYSSNGH